MSALVHNITQCPHWCSCCFWDHSTLFRSSGTKNHASAPQASWTPLSPKQLDHNQKSQGSHFCYSCCLHWHPVLRERGTLNLCLSKSNDHWSLKKYQAFMTAAEKVVVMSPVAIIYDTVMQQCAFVHLLWLSTGPIRRAAPQTRVVVM